jgi:hypothetical protein
MGTNAVIVITDVHEQYSYKMQYSNCSRYNSTNNYKKMLYWMLQDKATITSGMINGSFDNCVIAGSY